METPVLVTGAVALLVVLVLVLALLLRGRAESRRALSAAQVETAEIRDRLDALTDLLDRQTTTMVRVDDPAYVITDAGAAGSNDGQQIVPARVVIGATLGEPLVKAVAFGHGLRRALAAESRNKIWFEVRREVRRTRKQRRREMKDAWRRMQAQDRVPDADAA